MLRKRGVATATAVAVIAILGAGAVGVPTYVDSNADQMPDQSLYGLEIAGEHIKEAGISLGLYGNKASWQVSRWRERLSEFENMVAENKIAQHMGVLRRAQRRLKSACGYADNLHGLDRAENMCERHVGVLENVEKKVPENALWGVKNALRNAQRYEKGLQKAENKAKRRGPGADVRKNREEKDGEGQGRTRQGATRVLKCGFFL